MFAAAEMPFVAPEEACNITPMAHVHRRRLGGYGRNLTPYLRARQYIRMGRRPPLSGSISNPVARHADVMGYPDVGSTVAPRREGPVPWDFALFTRRQLAGIGRHWGGPPCLRWNVACRVRVHGTPHRLDSARTRTPRCCFWVPIRLPDTRLTVRIGASGSPSRPHHMPNAADCPSPRVAVRPSSHNRSIARTMCASRGAQRRRRLFAGAGTGDVRRHTSTYPLGRVGSLMGVP